MSTQTQPKDETFDGLDERMKRELFAHDQWVSECETLRQNQPENQDEQKGQRSS